MKNNLKQYTGHVLLQIAELILWLFCLAFLVGGCDSFTDVDLPKSQLTSAAVFEDRAPANAAMSDIYSKMRDAGLLTGSISGLSNQLGLYADELALYAGPGSLSSNFYNNALLATGGETSELWNSTFSQVYSANAVIEGVAGSSALPQSDRDLLRGEALFVRALLHFYLAGCYGDIPYITTTDYTVNRNIHRISESDALALVKSDLEEAVTLLPENYVGTERVRPNRYAAYALLARVCLYRGEWAEAANAASAVLNQSALYQWEPDLDKVFRKESTATIWQFMPGIPGDNTKEAATFSFVSGPPPLSALSQNLLDAFEPGDQRKVHWVKTVTDGTDSWSHAYKYKEPFNTGASVEYSVVLRLSEQYLVRAEARARQGELTAAKEDLNVVRNAAGLPDTPAITADEIINAILRERRVELFCEFGHRFFDLKRTSQLDAVLGATKSGWNATDRLFPIPQSELLLNLNLAPQNPGY
jgi:hypothetical protein